MPSRPKLLFALYVVPHITQQYAGEPNLAAPLLARSWIVLILAAFSAWSLRPSHRQLRTPQISPGSREDPDKGTMLGLLYLAWALANSAMLSWASSAETCLGYHVKRAYENDFGIVADLELLGQCSSHSSDVPNLRLVVEYQTSRFCRRLM